MLTIDELPASIRPSVIGNAGAPGCLRSTSIGPAPAGPDGPLTAMSTRSSSTGTNMSVSITSTISVSWAHAVSPGKANATAITRIRSRVEDTTLKTRFMGIIAAGRQVAAPYDTQGRGQDRLCYFFGGGARPLRSKAPGPHSYITQSAVSPHLVECLSPPGISW